MDPAYPYPRPSSRSLANTTTDPTRYPPYPPYASAAHPAAGYTPGAQGHAYDPATYPPYYVDDARRMPSQSMHASASYPGTASPPAHHYAGGSGSHAASAPAAGHAHHHGHHAHHGASYGAQSPPPLSPHLGGGYPYGAGPSQHAAGYAPEHAAYIRTPAQTLQQPRRSGGGSGGGGGGGGMGYAAPPSPESERFACDKCEKTFSRAHDRKRHHESQHAAHPYVHKCRFCRKEFSRADSLKRHIDNGCEKDPSFVEGAAVQGAP